MAEQKTEQEPEPEPVVGLESDDDEDFKDDEKQIIIPKKSEDKKSEDKTYKIFIKTHKHPNEYEITKQQARISKFLFSTLESTLSSIEWRNNPKDIVISFDDITNDTLGYIHKFLTDYNFNRPPYPIPIPIVTSQLSYMMTDVDPTQPSFNGKWAKIMDAILPQLVFSIAKASDKLDISFLFDLSCAKIATILKEKNYEEIVEIIDEVQYNIRRIPKKNVVVE